MEWVYCDGRYQVTALVYGKDEPAPDRLAFIRGALEDKLGRKTTFNVRYVAYDELGGKYECRRYHEWKARPGRAFYL